MMVTVHNGTVTSVDAREYTLFVRVIFALLAIAVVVVLVWLGVTTTQKP